MNKFALLLAMVLLIGGIAVAGESYVGYNEDGNQVHVVDGRIVRTIPRAAAQPRSSVGSTVRGRSVAPAPRFQGGLGHGPTGRVELNPYDPRKWWRDSSGMIDQINRDYPPAYPRRR